MCRNFRILDRPDGRRPRRPDRQAELAELRVRLEFGQHLLGLLAGVLDDLDPPVEQPVQIAAATPLLQDALPGRDRLDTGALRDRHQIVGVQPVESFELAKHLGTRLDSSTHRIRVPVL